MRLYDITQDMFQAEVYPGDPVPSKEAVMSLEKEAPDACQLTELTLGSHSGTHVDAPRHFYKEGKAVDEISLEKCIGPCKVAAWNGELTGDEVRRLLSDGTRRLLLKGKLTVTLEAAEEMTRMGLWCIGVEGLTVGPLSCPGPVHLELLGKETVILEGLWLSEVPEGVYQLLALPMKLGGLDGAPVRVVLAETE